ncbi:thiamine pyrophosphate-binding protein [Actinomadura sp. LD22]|uniref:Thiamine pyrophosphate-binding protein n=1 Tax=Actinomadura physcomitrii TaxID=2650748 RepID=A0A6I4M617_9ACTN|nr:thiamine pyrophosphate-binding protein [Actinomadura physcomitrii]MWA01578.1 thiamine pyrophosphate-binding protein [Actinomadura physcomitrii]
MGLNGGSLLAETVAEAARVIFTLHGGHLDSFFFGCRESGIELLDFRHEAAAVNAADGYARTTGGLGVAAVTSGPGFTNAYAGLANAYADGVPLLLITSAPPLGEAETNELQGGIDQIAAAGPVTKWAHRITAPERIPDLLGLAVRQALAGSPGPVVLELPIDVAFTPVDRARLRPAGAPGLGPRPVAAPEAVAQAVRVLQEAERPVIVAGEGTLWDPAVPALTRFAETTGIPVFSSGPARRTLPMRHPLNGQGVTSLAALAFAGRPGPDAVLLLGARLGMFTAGRPGTIIPADARLLQVDPDAAEIGRLAPVEVALNGDCAPTLRALLDAAQPGSWPDRTDWCERAVGAHRLLEGLFSDAPEEMGGRLHPYRAAREVLAALDPGSIIVTDGGESAAWAESAMTATEPDLVFRLGYQGHLGVGHGWAIGAQYAEPGRRVVQITGDGAVGFHIQELDTMVRHGLPIVTVVLSNDTWGMSIHGQDAVFGPGNDIITRLAPTGYERVAEAFGAHGERVDQLADLKPAMRRALESGRPALINVTISNEVVHPVTTALLGDVTATDQIVIPYYQNLPKADA